MNAVNNSRKVILICLVTLEEKKNKNKNSVQTETLEGKEELPGRHEDRYTQWPQLRHQRHNPLLQPQQKKKKEKQRRSIRELSDTARAQPQGSSS